MLQVTYKFFLIYFFKLYFKFTVNDLILPMAQIIKSKVPKWICSKLFHAATLVKVWQITEE